MNSSLFSIYYLATTASYGSPFYYHNILGSGAQSKAYKLNNPVLMLNAGDHSFFKISKQIAPV